MSQQNQPNPLLKFSGMAAQMAVIIGLSVYGGQKLDAHYQTQTPWYTLGLSLFGIAAALYLTLRDLLRK